MKGRTQATKKSAHTICISVNRYKNGQTVTRMIKIRCSSSFVWFTWIVTHIYIKLLTKAYVKTKILKLKMCMIYICFYLGWQHNDWSDLKDSKQTILLLHYQQIIRSISRKIYKYIYIYNMSTLEQLWMWGWEWRWEGRWGGVLCSCVSLFNILVNDIVIFVHAPFLNTSHTNGSHEHGEKNFSVMGVVASLAWKSLTLRCYALS